MKIRTLILTLVSLAVLALCWLALDDITTGRQPSFYLEWAMVAVGALWFGGLALARWRSRGLPAGLKALPIWHNPVDAAREDFPRAAETSQCEKTIRRRDRGFAAPLGSCPCKSAATGAIRRKGAESVRFHP
jgi:hypothetical protein